MFDLARVKVNRDASLKAIMVKLSPTTEVYAMVLEVGKSLPNMRHSKVVRLLIRVGFAAFIKSERERGVRE